MRSSGIGGQAVIEGVMMKNKDQYAVAVRTPEDTIVVDKQTYKSFSDSHGWARLPLIRGVITFIESLSIGMKTLTYSASFYEEEEQKESKVEKAFANVFKEKAEGVVMGITVVVAVLVAIALFMILPWFVAEKVGALVSEHWIQALLEGVLRLVIFILYIFVISLTEDIKRVYMYHGAEHKTINCVENGLELTVENVRKQSREHKRCGTSFLLYVMIISILFFMFIRVDNAALRIVLRVVLIPVVAGVSYECIRFMGNHDNFLVKILSRPGFWMQGMTTREPDDAMIEVAIQSVEAVFDWRGYLQALEEGTLEEFFGEKEGKFVTMKAPSPSDEDLDEEDQKALTEDKKVEPSQTPRVAALKKAEHSVRRGAYFHNPENETKHTASEKAEEVEELEEEEIYARTSSEEKEDTVHKVATLKKAQTVRCPLPIIEDARRDSIFMDTMAEEEDDEILNALDKFFDE